jgi:Holliday junction resolvase
MINSIKKGKNFEREVAHYLTVKTGVGWLRVPSSGALQTIHNTHTNAFRGDVFTENEEYRDFTIECKSYAKLDLNDVFNKESKLYSWIEQCRRESILNQWFLFIKIKNKGYYIICEPHDKSEKLAIFGLGKNIIFDNYIMYYTKNL